MRYAYSFPWRMPLLIRISFVLHAMMLATLAIYPSCWPWVVVIAIANHAVIALVGLWPRSTWIGLNWTRLPAAAAACGEIALTIDDGPDPEVTPHVLGILARYDVKANFFCIGDRAARYPDLCRSITEAGHTVENHSQHHRHNFSLLGMSALTREIQTAQDTLTLITGRRPQFFRAPAGLRNPFLDPVLARLGLRLASWTRRGFDTCTADASTVSRRLMQDMKAGTIFLVHDGNCAQSSAGVPVILEVLPTLLEAAAASGLCFVTLSSVAP